MFASKVTDKVEINDGEDVVVVVIRKLSASSLKKAAEAKQIEVGAFARNMGKDMLSIIREESAAREQKKAEAVTPETEKTPEQKREERYSSFDRDFVLKAGIQSWTASTKLSPAAIEDLDEEAADKLHRRIVDLSLPLIDPAEAEAAQAKQ